jgi:hypothetical protein
MVHDILGLQEIADLAGVSSSAVANWRRRFPGFPPPIAELKSGPVFDAGPVRTWLARRGSPEFEAATRFYDRLAATRGDDPELVAAVEQTAEKLTAQDTSIRRPGMLLGKVQSGKTRAFLGVIARAFDSGFDVAVILTKGTKSLAKQTLSRVREDFREFLASDEVQVFDIMSLPALTPYELSQRIVLVVKKEDDNLRRLLSAFTDDYPSLQSKRVLVIDDEADMASVSFRREEGLVKPGKLSGQIDNLRALVSDLAYLQVTATPYSLYLQPENDIPLSNGQVYTPKRPAFTVSLPTHDAYVGGDHYFEQDADASSPAFYFYKEVPRDEREALKVEDRRRLKIENVLTETRAAVLRDALVTFLVGAAIRRIQERSKGRSAQKYSFLFHTEQAKKSHEWQERVAVAIRDALVHEAEHDTPRFNELLARAMSDLARSVASAGTTMPEVPLLKKEVVEALVGGQMMVTKVNSDKEVDELLDESGQLKLRTPMNVFIGGQILDRGVTIGNLIGFYYGRDPKRFQQDTVLQHSRMYGVRPLTDLAVTRFYAPLHVYQLMRKIHAFDAALRDAFESGAHDRGVYFIQKDAHDHLIPCSPNKLLASRVSSIRPGRRLLPIGFQTVARSNGAGSLKTLDRLMMSVTSGKETEPVLVEVSAAVSMLEAAYENLEFDELRDDDRRAHIAALEHLSRTSRDSDLRGKVWVLRAVDRNVVRYREEGRFSNSPDTKQQTELAQRLALDVPVLLMLRQEGTEAQGWRGLPFWWPVIVTPRNAPTTIFATDVAVPAADPPS